MTDKAIILVVASPKYYKQTQSSVYLRFSFYIDMSKYPAKSSTRTCPRLGRAHLSYSAQDSIVANSWNIYTLDSASLYFIAAVNIQNKMIYSTYLVQTCKWFKGCLFWVFSVYNFKQIMEFFFIGKLLKIWRGTKSL